jgi:hypothetical protein
MESIILCYYIFTKKAKNLFLENDCRIKQGEDGDE